jgi:hypothetical protein
MKHKRKTLFLKNHALHILLKLCFFTVNVLFEHISRIWRPEDETSLSQKHTLIEIITNLNALNSKYVCLFYLRSVT